MSRNDKTTSTRGASNSQTGYGDMIRAWRQHHAFSASDSLQRLLHTPIQTTMTALVVAIALALPATLLLALTNVERLGESWDTTPKLTAFLHVRAQDAAIKNLIQTLENAADVQSIAYLTPTQALAQFQTQSGFSDALNGLDENPLPPTLIITPKAQALAPETLEALANRIGNEAIVESVDLDMVWVKRLRAIMALGQTVVLALAGLLGFGVLLAIGNTVRLAIENRKDEIIVTKLVGGTNGFVRRPFLYCGTWYGLIGGLLACVLVSIGFASINAAVANLATSYASDFTLKSLGPGEALLLLAASMVLGWLGAWLAVGRHLHQIEPR